MKGITLKRDGALVDPLKAGRGAGLDTGHALACPPRGERIDQPRLADGWRNNKDQVRDE